MNGVNYGDIVASLRIAYDRGAPARDLEVKSAWKLEERAAFLERLRAEGRRRLIELGAGTGQDSLYFQSHGIEVVATDATLAMVDHCRAKGLHARQMDFLNLAFDSGSFDAVYAMNCLLHVPNAEMPKVLSAIGALLVPGGLFFVGCYRGEDTEGPLPEDSHDPPRFFSLRRDETLLKILCTRFELVDMHTVDLGDYAFQSVTLRRPD